jgi:hypothetical protein
MQRWYREQDSALISGLIFLSHTLENLPEVLSSYPPIADNVTIEPRARMNTRASKKRQMRGFTSSAQAQRCLSVHGQVHNLFRVGRHLLRAVNYRVLRGRGCAVSATRAQFAAGQNDHIAPT